MMRNKLSKSFVFALSVMMSITSIQLPAHAQESTDITQLVTSTDSNNFAVEKKGSVSLTRAKLNFVFNQSQFQVTGLMYWPEESYTITVSGLDPDDPYPSIAFSQNLEHLGDADDEDLVSTVKITGDRDANGDVTCTIKAPSMVYPGAIYIVNPYTPEQQTGDVHVSIIKQEGTAPDWYPVYKQNDDLDSFKNQLIEYKTLMDSGEGYPQYVDIYSDFTLISTSFDAAYDMYVEGKDDSGNTGSWDPDTLLESTDDALKSEYRYANLSEAEFPVHRQQVRAIEKQHPFFATNGYVGFDNGMPEHYSYEILKPSFYDEWGPLHEFGHVIENRKIRFKESTNNLYVMNRLKEVAAKKNEEYISRLDREKRYDKLFSTYSSQKNNVSFYLNDFEIANSNYRLDQLSLWDRLSVMDQLNQYFRHNQITDKIDTSIDFWTEITEEARHMNFSGPEVNDALNKIVILAAKEYAVDIRPFFRVLNLDDRFVYLEKPYIDSMPEGEVKIIAQSLNDLPKINPNARYIDETYVKNPTGSIAGAKANITKIEAKGESNKVSIELQDGDPANLLGYKVYRTNAGVPLFESTDFIGYAKASTNGEVTFADTLSVANYLFDYYAVPVGKNLEDAAISEKHTSDGNPQEQGEVQINDVNYNQFVDVLSIKGIGYKENSSGNTNYIQLIINGSTFDISALNPILNPNTVDEVNKNFISFYPQKDGSWEMRIKGFGQINLKDGNNDILDIYANLVENYMVELPEVGKSEEHQRILSQSIPVLRNLGDIFVEGTSSPLLKSIEVEGIKGNVDQKFDPLLDTYTGERQYVKRSLSEIDNTKTILKEPTEELKIKLNPADDHASYKIYATQKTYTYSSQSAEPTIETGNRIEMNNGVFQVSADRAATYSWDVDAEVTSADGQTSTYSFEIYSPNEDAYLSSTLIANEVSPSAVNPDLWAADQDLTNDYIFVKVGTNAAANKDKFVRIMGVPRNHQATWSVYHKVQGNSSLNEEIEIDRRPDGNYYTSLTTEQFRNGTDIHMGVVAQDGVTLKEYHLITELTAEAKNTANLQEVEISGQGGKQVGYVKDFLPLDTSGLKSFVKPLYEKPENKYEGIYMIAPTTADTTNEDEAEMVSLTLRPVVDFFTSDQANSPKISWDYWTMAEGKSYPISEKNAPATVTLTENKTSLKIRPNELKKLNMHQNSTIQGGLENGVINITDYSKYLRLTITSQDGKNMKRFLFLYQPSGKSPLLTYQNVAGNITIFNRDLYDPENKALAEIDNTISNDLQYYIYEATDTKKPVTFKPQTHVAAEYCGTVHELINGVETPVFADDSEFYQIDDQATGFIYRIDSPDGMNHFTYRFSKYRPTDSTLKTLSTNGYLVHLDQDGNAVEGFDPDVTEYYMVTNDLNDIKIETEANDSESEIIPTLDGQVVAPIKRAVSRSFRQVQENNAQSDEMKEYQVNVKAQSDATTVYSILVSNKFDFLNLGEAIGETEKTDLQSKLTEAQKLLNQGNLDTLLYDDLSKAMKNANSLLQKNYVVEEDYETAADHLTNLMERYSSVLSDDYINLYNETIPSIEDGILKHPTALRDTLRKNGSEKFIINDDTLIFYVGSDTEVTIPAEVTKIGAYAFDGCTELEKVDLTNVNSIGYAAFANCNNLSEIVSYKDGSAANRSFWNTKITMSNELNWLYDNEGNELIGSVTSPEVFSVPMGTISIDAYAFHGLTNVKSIIIPYTVTTIGTKAFLNSSGLETVNFSGNKLSLDYVFDDSIIPNGMDKAPEYNVTISQESDDASNIPNFNIKGDGSYQVGEILQVTAPFNNDYIFAGWKHSKEETSYFSTASTLNLTITEDTNLVAYYTSAPTYTVNLEYDNAGGTVNTNESLDKIKYGAAITLSAKPKSGYKFDGWYSDGKFVSQETIYTDTVLANKTIKAQFTQNEVYTVTFADSYGVVYKTETVESGQSATAPENVSRVGYLFDGWDRDYSSITQNTVIHAKFKMAPAVYEITIENGRYMDSKNPHVYSYGELVRVIANVAPRNMKFSHWENEKGTIVSYDTTYSFGATESTQLKAVYAKEVEEKPIALLNNINIDSTISKMSFIGQVIVPENYETIEFGLLLYKGEGLTEELTFATVGAAKGKSSVANAYGQFSKVAKMIAGQKATARIYLICRNKSDNTLTTVYSDVKTAVMQ